MTKDNSVMGLTMTTLAVLAASMTSAVAQSAYPTEPTLAPPAVIDAGKLTMVMNASAPPAMYMSETGEFVGYRAEMGRELALRLGLEPVFINATFQPQIPGLNAGRWDISISGAFITEERAQIVEMIPTESQGVSIVTSIAAAESINSTDDLAGMSIGAEQGGYEWRALEAISAGLESKGLKALDLRGFERASIAYQALTAGQIDAVASNDPGAFYYTHNSSSNHIQALTGLAPAPQSIAIRGGNSELSQAVSAALVGMKEDGFYDELVANWGFGPAEDFTFPVIYNPASK